MDEKPKFVVLTLAEAEVADIAWGIEANASAVAGTNISTRASSSAPFVARRYRLGPHTHIRTAPKTEIRPTAAAHNAGADNLPRTVAAVLQAAQVLG